MRAFKTNGREWTIAISLLFMGAMTVFNSIGLNKFIPIHEQTNDETIVVEVVDELPARTNIESAIRGAANENQASTPTVIIENEEAIPEALQPVTFEGCCPEDLPNLFLQTCLTERACKANTTYPFTSPQERNYFTKHEIPRGPTKMEFRERCDRANEQLRPPTKWCSKDNATLFPMGCSHFSMAGGSGPYDRTLLFTKGKLAFCAIPKAGITQWLQFLRFTLGAKDYQTPPYFKKDSKYFYFDMLRPEVQDEIWNGGNWTKAILIREPAERLLSAYLDKVAPHPHKRQQSIINNIKNQRNQRRRDNEQGRRRLEVRPFGLNVTFEEFVDILAMDNITKYNDEFRGNTGISWRTDPHWRPQAWSCGLSENVAQFDYIGTLDNAALHTKALLQQVDMWESFGKYYRVSEKRQTEGPPYSIWPPKPLKPGESAIGFQQEGANDNDRHNRDSKSKLDKYYTLELMKKVREIYWMDFALYDAVKEAEKEGKVRGIDIVSKLNPECVVRKA